MIRIFTIIQISYFLRVIKRHSASERCIFHSKEPITDRFHGIDAVSASYHDGYGLPFQPAEEPEVED